MKKVKEVWNETARPQSRAAQIEDKRSHRKRIVADQFLPLAFSYLLPHRDIRVLSGKVDVVSMLLTFETIDVNMRNKAGSTALDLARHCQMLDIAKCLEAHAHFR